MNPNLDTPTLMYHLNPGLDGASRGYVCVSVCPAGIPAGRPAGRAAAGGEAAVRR